MKIGDRVWGLKLKLQWGLQWRNGGQIRNWDIGAMQWWHETRPGDL